MSFLSWRESNKDFFSKKQKIIISITLFVAFVYSLTIGLLFPGGAYLVCEESYCMNPLFGCLDDPMKSCEDFMISWCLEAPGLCEQAVLLSGTSVGTPPHFLASSLPFLTFLILLAGSLGVYYVRE